jgi:hypothetical protein
MNNFLNSVFEAHGGLKRWGELTKVNVTIVSGGKLFELQGQPQDGSPREMEVVLHQEHASMRPYGAPDQQTNFSTERIAIETVHGEVISERTGSIEILHNHMKSKGWDSIDRAYFNGYANWTYLTTPFFMSMPGMGLSQIAPWKEDGQSWEGIRVTFPPNIATHNQIQDFYFGEDFLLRRHDYFIDVAGDFPATQYVFDYREVNGIHLPTKRRAYKRSEDGSLMKEELMVYIDYSNIQFS